MKLTKVFTAGLFLFLLSSCETLQNGEIEGFDMQGERSSCIPMREGKICTEIFTAEDRFAAKCAEKGHEVVQCDCHKFLCKTKLSL